MINSILIARKPNRPAVSDAADSSCDSIVATSEEAFRLARRLSALLETRRICLLSGLGDIGLVHELASQLAGACAATGRGPVLLVDGNLGRPMLHQWHNARSAPGLADVLARSGAADAPDLASVIQATPSPQVFLLTAGPADGRRVTIKESLAVEAIFERLRADYSLVLVSCATILGERGTGVLAAHADCAAILVEAGMDQRSDLTEAASAFEALQVPLLGAILCNMGRR